MNKGITKQQRRDNMEFFFLFKTKQEKLDPSKRGQGTQFKAQIFFAKNKKQ